MELYLANDNLFFCVDYVNEEYYFFLYVYVALKEGEYVLT